MANPNMKKGAPSVNPSGRPPDSPSIRRGKKALAKLCPKAVKVLGELLETGNEKTRATVGLGVVKATIGELSRVGAEGGGDLVPALQGATIEQLMEMLSKLKR